MLQVMLCGAHDVREISPIFRSVVRGFGGEPWFYQDGKIRHVNSLTSRWSENSRTTVSQADVCVFVILEEYGEITWNDELDEALSGGKPFVVLALESAWSRYNTLYRNSADDGVAYKSRDSKMLDLLRRFMLEYQFTIVPFGLATFGEKLQDELSNLFQTGLKMIQDRNRRAQLIEALEGRREVSRNEIEKLKELAKDDYEPNKLARKTAIRRLARLGVEDSSLLLDICRSQEQGVQRLGFELIPELSGARIDVELIEELGQIADQSRDLGIERRFVAALASVCPEAIDIALCSLGRHEEGVRKICFQAIEENWETILPQWGKDRMTDFLKACLDSSLVGVEWRERLEQRILDLT